MEEDDDDLYEFFEEEDLFPAWNWLRRNSRRATLARRVGSVHVVNYADIVAYRRMSPGRRIILLFLLLSLRDMATELRFEPWRFVKGDHWNFVHGDDPDAVGIRVLYVVNGDVHELVPPPPCMAKAMIRDVESVAGFFRPRMAVATRLRRLACAVDGQPHWDRYGRFLMTSGEIRSVVDVRVCDSELGDRVYLSFSDVTKAHSDAAEDAIKRFLTVHRKGTAGGSDRDGVA